MRRLWIWIFPAAIVLAILWLSFRSVPPMAGIITQACAFALLALALEAVLRTACAGLPMYRRHLLIFISVAVAGALDTWLRSRNPVLDGLVSTLAGALGLVLASLPFLWTRRLRGASWWRGIRRRPDPARPLILVADPHWGEELTGLHEATTAHPEADWLFLGDVFDVWLGLKGLETDAQRAFLWWVRERRQAGRWVGLWAGNREYFLDGLAPRFDLMGEGIGGGLPEEALAWEHGDLINGADGRYRLWNLVSRSGPVWLLARLLPAPLARRLSVALEASLRTTNGEYKLDFPREAFRAAVREHPDATYITGHFHVREEEGRGVALPWAHAGDFCVWERGRVATLETPKRRD